MTVNEKHIRPYDLRDMANYLFLSNDSTPIYIDDDDRRFFIIKISKEVPVGLQEAYDRWYRKPEAASAIISYLLGISLKGFKPNRRPVVTGAKLDVVDSNRTDLERFIIDECLGNYDKTFSLGGAPTGCDFQSAASVGERFDRGRATRLTSTTAIGRILGRLVDLRRIVKLRRVRLTETVQTPTPCTPSGIRTSGGASTRTKSANTG